MAKGKHPPLRTTETLLNIVLQADNGTVQLRGLVHLHSEDLDQLPVRTPVCTSLPQDMLPNNTMYFATDSAVGTDVFLGIFPANRRMILMSPIDLELIQQPWFSLDGVSWHWTKKPVNKLPAERPPPVARQSKPTVSSNTFLHTQPVQSSLCVIS